MQNDASDWSDAESELSETKPLEKPLEKKAPKPKAVKREPTPEEREKAIQLMEAKPKRTLNISEEERQRRRDAMKVAREKRYVYDEVRREAKQEAKLEAEPVRKPRAKKAVEIVEEDEPKYTLKQIQELTKIVKPKGKPRGRPFGKPREPSPPPPKARAPPARAPRAAAPQQPVYNGMWLNGRPIRIV